VAWKDFEYPEFFFRLDDLRKARDTVCARATYPYCTESEAIMAEETRRGLDRAIEETMLEFMAYRARRKQREP
jgi:hypothetical protein